MQDITSFIFMVAMIYQMQLLKYDPTFLKAVQEPCYCISRLLATWFYMTIQYNTYLIRSDQYNQGTKP